MVVNRDVVKFSIGRGQPERGGYFDSRPTQKSTRSSSRNKQTISSLESGVIRIGQNEDTFVRGHFASRETSFLVMCLAS